MAQGGSCAYPSAAVPEESDEWVTGIGSASVTCQPANGKGFTKTAPGKSPATGPLLKKREKERWQRLLELEPGGEKKKPAGQSRVGLVLYRKGGWIKQQEQSTEKEQSEKLEKNQLKEPKGLRLSEDWGMQVPEGPGKSNPKSKERSQVTKLILN